MVAAKAKNLQAASRWQNVRVAVCAAHRLLLLTTGHAPAPPICPATRGGLSRRLMAGDTRQFTRWGFYATLVVTSHCGSTVKNPTNQPPEHDKRQKRTKNQKKTRTQALLLANHDKSLAG